MVIKPLNCVQNNGWLHLRAASVRRGPADSSRSLRARPRQHPHTLNHYVVCASPFSPSISGQRGHPTHTLLNLSLLSVHATPSYEMLECRVIQSVLISHHNITPEYFKGIQATRKLSLTWARIYNLRKRKENTHAPRAFMHCIVYH